MPESTEPRWWQEPKQWMHHLLFNHVRLTREDVGTVWICTSRFRRRTKMVFQPEGLTECIPVPDEAALQGLAQQPDRDAAMRYLLH